MSALKINRSEKYKSHHFKRTMRYLFVALLPLIICWILILEQSHKWAMSITEQNAMNLLEKNAEMIDLHFTGLRQNVYSLMNDQNLNKLVADSSKSPSNYYDYDSEIDSIVSQYFWNLEGINSMYIVSSSYSDIFFNATALPRIVKPENIVYRNRLSTLPTWYPAAKLNDVIHLGSRYSAYFSNYNVITLGVLASSNYVFKGVMYRSWDGQEQPMILLNLNISIFDKWLKNDHLLDDTTYRIYTKDLEPVYASDNLDWDKVDLALLPVPGSSNDSSTPNRSYVEEQGKGTFIYSQELNETGWIITSYTSVNSAFLYFGNSISLVSLIVFLLTIILVLIVVRLSLRSISEPLSLLCDGLNKTADGDYKHRINSTRYGSYLSAFQAYNSMNEHIERLIKENYDVKLSEKEMEIRMINMQFNPHFLYNIMNAISLKALENGLDSVSEMLRKLSYMMRYSTKTTSDIVPFHEDLYYIETYISVMQMRTNEEFEYFCDIDPALVDLPVPKFMLQPFVENAILHGFSLAQDKYKYKLSITGRLDGEDVYFSVIDNGKGFNQQAIETLWKKENLGIGIANTHERIQLYYGEKYGVSINSRPGEGAVITIHIPYRKS